MKRRCTKTATSLCQYRPTLVTFGVDVIRTINTVRLSTGLWIRHLFEGHSFVLYRAMLKGSLSTLNRRLSIYASMETLFGNN